MIVNDDVLRIIEILEFRRQPTAVKKKRIGEWFGSDDPNVIGAAVDVLLQYSEYIDPAPTRREVGEFLMKNFEVSLARRGEKASIYAYNCHEAAKELYAWMIACYNALPERKAEECLHLAKEFLVHRYRNGDGSQRSCIVAGALEHLFEVDGLREFFMDWQAEPDLREAYRKAEAWSSWLAACVRSVELVASLTADLLRSRGFEAVMVHPPTIGTTMPVVTWENGEPHQLAIDCDEAWVRGFESSAVDIERAANFAASRSNWSQSANLPTHFTVHLNGDRFTIGSR